MATYSFLDVTASINGPGGAFSLIGCNSAEGVTIVYDDDKTATMTGADGCIMHSLRGTMTGTMTFNFLKISYMNTLLNQLFNYQRRSSQWWGYNVITVRDVARGDNYNLTTAAFVKHPDNTYAQDGNTLAWQFRGYLTVTLGGGNSAWGPSSGSTNAGGFGSGISGGISGGITIGL